MATGQRAHTTVAEGLEVPHPKGIPFLGNIFDVDPNAFTESVLQISKQPPFRELFSLTFAGERFVIINTRDLLDEICNESRFVKTVTSGLQEMRNVAGQGLFTAFDGEEEWEIAHRILMPLLGTLKVRDMWPQMKDIATQLCLKWARHGDGAAIDIAGDFTRLTLDTIALCTMGYRFNSFYNGDKQHPFVDSMLRVLVEANQSSRFPSIINSTLRRRQVQRNKREVEFLRSMADTIVKERKRKTVSTHDLLDAMLSGRDPKTGKGMSDKLIADNLVTFLIAGHETTSGMLSFAFYFLSQHPEAMARAQQEVDDVVGSQPVALEHVGRLHYIAAVLREALRLQPTAPGFAVSPKEDTTIGGRWRIPQGEPIIAHLHAIQRDEAVWGKDADEFRPERMLDEHFDKLPKNAWKPFGNGARGCIGRPFAWQEAILVTTMVLQNFTMEPVDPKYRLKIKQSLTIKPDGFMMRAKLRRGNDNVSELATTLQGASSASSWSSAASTVNQDSHPGLRTGNGPITILHASNSGTSKALAHRLAADTARMNFSQPSIHTLDSATKSLPNDQPVIIITASYDGRPADDAQVFLPWLESLDTTAKPLAGVSYAIFGCGHRDWPQTLFKVPRVVDNVLSRAGATRLAPMGTTDTATGDLFSDLEVWAQNALWPGLVGQQVRDGVAAEKDEIRRLLALEAVSPRHETDLQRGLRFLRATVRDARVLTAPEEESVKRHLELDLPSTAAYETGDHLIVLPSNPPATVKRVLDRLGLEESAVVNVKGGEPETASEFLRKYVELAQPATPRDIRLLAAASSDPIDKATLEALGAPDSSTLGRDRDARTSILDLLERFPSVQLPLVTFLEIIPAMRTRTYSISSAAPIQVNKGDTGVDSLVPASLTYTVLDAPARYNAGSGSRRFLGVASNYLANLAARDTLRVSVKKGRAGFRLPLYDAQGEGGVSVLIAAGSGIAPFRGFLQERRRQVQGRGTIMLVFGCRGPEDDIYRSELDDMEKDGLVSVYRAYSKSDLTGAGVVKGYVQDVLTAQRAEFVDMWRKGAKFLVCGGTRMASEVKGIVAEIAREAQLGSGSADSKDNELLSWFSQFEPERYCADVFA